MSARGSSSGSNFRSRTGSHGARDLIAGHNRNSRRHSQMNAGINHPTLQKMVEEWQMRERPSLETENGEKSLLLESDGVADVITLSPTGEIISIVFPWFLANVRTRLDIKLSEFKHLLFEQIGPMKWSGFSTKPQDYVFRQLDSFGEIEVIFNDDQPLSKLELHGTFPMLFLYQPDGLNRDDELMEDITHCLGYPLDKLEDSLDEELRQFRASLWSRTKQTCLNRGVEGTKHYAFPEEQYFGATDIGSTELETKVKAANLNYQLFWRKRRAELTGSCEKMVTIPIKFDKDFTPYTLLIAFLQETHRLDICDSEDPTDEEWILQLAGRTTYLTNPNVKLTSYEGVRSDLESYRSPGFVVRRRSIVLLDYVRPKPLYEPHYVRAHERKLALDVLSVSIDNTPKQKTKNSDKVMTDFRPTASLKQALLWDIDENLMLRPVTLTGFEIPQTDHTYVRLEFKVYVGTLILATHSSTKVNSNLPRWNTEKKETFLIFDLYMKDMPPSALLNVTAYYGKIKLNSEETEIGWVNMPLTNWRDELLQGEVVYHLWAPGGNVDRSRIGENSARVGCNATVTLQHFSYRTGRIQMPGPSHYTYLADHRSTWMEAVHIRGDHYETCVQEPGYKVLHEMVKKHENGLGLNEDEEKHIWNWRRFAQKHEPDLLIPLSELRLVWTDRENFSDLYMLLDKWKPPSIAAAFTLLGKRCTDRVIRKFAVEKLNEQLHASNFHLFILPLIQALKYEPRAQSEVGMMLLTRALKDYRVGHRLFWLLRAEIARLSDMKSEECRRISLLMEAYLRGNEDHIKTIIKQVDMVNELTCISALVKGMDKERGTQKLREELREAKNKMENMDSPLDPVYKLGELYIEKACVLGSAKRPLRLVWKNKNPKSDLHIPLCEMIFKNGDDLRQDMLVLQVLEVMDNIWKSKNIDCCLSPYSVLPMGTNIGIIEVVPKCRTVFEIQNQGNFVNTAARSIDSSFMNKWIRTKCGLEEKEDKKKKESQMTSAETEANVQATKKYLESVDRFLYSCVGYSIATYIMGIKDRHSDNIMLTEDGKLFHIDFGHILGHGKTKLGIQRDRQPFVLTEHFLTVISSGNSVKNTSHEIQKFKKLCIDAYLIMWGNRDLFVSLFTLMLGMELPELSTQEDLDHLKGTLCYTAANPVEAGEFFGSVYEETFNSSWSTKTNWMFHALKHF